MKNWIRSVANNWVNLDYITQVYVHKDGEKFKVIGLISGSETGFLLSQDFDAEAEAIAFMDSLPPWRT